MHRIQGEPELTLPFKMSMKHKRKKNQAPYIFKKTSGVLKL